METTARPLYLRHKARRVDEDGRAKDALHLARTDAERDEITRDRIIAELEAKAIEHPTGKVLEVDGC